MSSGRTATCGWSSSTAVLVNDVLFGLSSRNAGQYFALNATTGQTLWTSPPRQTPQAAIVSAGDMLFSLEADGELVLLRATTAGFQPVQRYRVAETATWAPPVISGRRVFIKDVNTLTAWTWDQHQPAAAPQPVEAASGPTSETMLRADILFWESIRDKTDAALFDAYLRQFPNGMFRVLAEARLKELRSMPPPPSTGPTAPGARPAAFDGPPSPRDVFRWVVCRAMNNAAATNTRATGWTLRRSA